MKRGFTLLELLIVMAIIVFVMAAAAPSLSRWLVERQILEAVKSVRLKLYAARLGAMRSGHTYAYQYQTGSGSYRLAQEDKLESQSGGSVKSSGDQESSADDGPPPQEGVLPNGMHFMADNAANADADTEESQDVAKSNGDNAWSDPVLFYPDGTTSDARFRVADGRGYAVRIRLRGVTGNVVVESITKVRE